MDVRLRHGYRNSQESETTTNVGWDVFLDTPRKPEVGSTVSTKTIDVSEKLLRIFTYGVNFIAVLGFAVLSKGTLLFMTSQIKPNATRYYCKKLALDPKQQFRVTLPLEERSQWIWMLLFAYFVPELGTFVRSLRICYFKTVSSKPTWTEWLSLFLTEICPAIGSALLIFVVLQELDVIKGAMLTNAVCLVPGLVAFLSRDPACKRSLIPMILDVASLACQTVALVLWPLVEGKLILYTITASVLLISIGWWENFVSKESPYFKKFTTSRLVLENKTYFMYLFLAPMKCLAFFITACVILVIQDGDIGFLFRMDDAFSSHNINITEIIPIVGSSSIHLEDAISTGYNFHTTTNVMTPIWVWLINILATYLCYAFGKFSCKILMQSFCFAFPINLTVPVVIAALIGMSGEYNVDVCAYRNIIPEYLFFNTPSIYFLSEFIGSQYSWIWVLWLFSQSWITIHIWYPHVDDKLARTEKLFYKPMYDAFLIDQSIALNRRRNHPLNEKSEVGEVMVDMTDENSYPRIYACGTMWHEEREEMMEFLKSIVRLDKEQFKLKKQKDFQDDIPRNYFELETHIFFDDAFVLKKKKKQEPEIHVNRFVKDLIEVVSKAPAEVLGIEKFIMAPPIKTPTPYGGRLEWTLPGGTKLYAHLKDKSKIRPKKRWSQVMYMYYLLGHKLIDRKDLTNAEKVIISANTYILALDGDIDFQPKAVHALIDLMKKTPTLGAACGRIHPIGHGAMAWYQIFEYAVGHWLQKATEHVIGCVLCSPGCFSLFRGTALMGDSVMKKYTTVATEPIHLVQYDQGEDRWLCTLLLQQGYRVEYSAASDSYTHCPEGFNEFYNQRRRWMPSTTANIIDLLQDAKHTVKINDNISQMYIFYQVVMLIGTVLGSGTIFLMLVGAFVAAFKLDQWTSFGYNLVPILVFVIICATCKADTQLFFAGLISAVYGLIMMAVLVGVLLQIKDDGWFAPSTLFFFMMAGEFIVTALLHPSEFYCLKYGVIYYVTVPSMYMLLVIYSVFNMNNVSWGTRDVTVEEEEEEDKDEDKEEQDKNAKKDEKKIFSYFGADNDQDAGSIEFSFAGLFKLMFCTHKSKDNEQLILIQTKLEMLMKKLDHIETVKLEEKNPKIDEPAKPAEVQGDTLSIDSYNFNRWMETELLDQSKTKLLDEDEKNFWNQLIEKYLHPLDEKSKAKELTKSLNDLRDKTTFTFFMINSLFVLVVFLLTLEKDMLYLPWPLDPKVNFTYQENIETIEINIDPLKLEPIGFVFLIFFFLLLIVQFVGMFVHRFGTFTQIMSNTDISFANEETEEKNINDAIDAATKIRKEVEKVDRRKTIKTLLEKPEMAPVTSLEDAFEKNWDYNMNKNPDPVIRRKTVLAGKRRDTIYQRRSVMPNRLSQFQRNASSLPAEYAESN